MKKYSLVVIFLIVAFGLNYTVQNRWKGDDWKMAIGSDGYGYYGYLPCIFIYHSLDFNKAITEERKFCVDAGGPFQYNENRLINKCFIGVAILLAPFFLIAYALSYLMGTGTGGYEFLFEASVGIGALFYLGLGLIFIRKLLKEYNMSEFIISLTLILLVLGTNLIYYATIEPSMSHLYSFSMGAVFLFYTKRSVDDFRFKNLVWMAVAMSILVLIRPTNILGAALIVFFAGSIKNTLTFLKKLFSSKEIIGLLLIVTAILSIQFIMWKLTSGHFFFWSYPGEGFDFLHSHFIDILFSYRKGWFVYTPLMLIAVLAGLIALYKQNRFLFMVALLFTLLVILVFSSWGTWAYEGDFGLRAFIDFYAFFAFLLGIFLNSLTSIWTKTSIIVIGILCISLNFFQMFQYTHWIMPCAGMDKDKYWSIFLKYDVEYQGMLDRPDTTGFNTLNNYHYVNDFEHNTWGHDENITTKFAHNGTHSAFASDDRQVCPQLALKASDLPQNKTLFVLVKLWAYMPDMDNKAILLVCVKPQKGDAYLWHPKNLKGFVFHPNTWTEAYDLVQLPAFKDPTDEVDIVVTNSKGVVYIDDMDVIFETPK